MEDCWKQEPEKRISAAEIVQRISRDGHSSSPSQLNRVDTESTLSSRGTDNHSQQYRCYGPPMSGSRIPSGRTLSQDAGSHPQQSHVLVSFSCPV
jgi:hypothetical protein